MQLRNTLLGAAAIVVVLAVVELAIALKDPAQRGDAAPARRSAGGPRSEAPTAGAPAVSGSDEPPRSARQDRVDMVAAIDRSGPAAEAWSDQGESLLRALGAQAVAITETGCFLAGCAAVVTFSSMAEYQRRRAELEATTPFATWTGSKRWSEPEAIAGGHVIVALVLDRPD